MKMAKRILSLVLVLAMVACLGVTAFADSATPVVNVAVNGVQKYSYNGTVGASVYSVVEGSGLAKWKTVTDYYDPDVTHQALVSFAGLAPATFNAKSATDCENLKKATNYEATDITWYDSLPGYGLISYDSATGIYTFIYAGYDWTYTSTLQKNIYDYMCCYTLKANEVVTVNYGFNASIWTSEYPLV